MAMTKGFRQALKERQEQIDSLVCVGLDPIPEELPKCLITGSSDIHVAEDIATWMKAMVDTTAPHASMFKPQKAHYEAFRHGDVTLQSIVKHINLKHPEIPVFLDCKRVDIGRRRVRYKIAHFELDGVDGMNFSPYMGEDCMEHLVDKNHLERAIVGLCYTSNPKARKVQDVLLADGRMYWEFMAEEILNWAKELGIVENAGLVMAAAFENPKGSEKIYSEHLTRCRNIVGDSLWFLIPGVGTQGGYVAQTIQHSFFGYGSIAINSSSEINFASSGKDFAEAAGEKAKELHDKTRVAS